MNSVLNAVWQNQNILVLRWLDGQKAERTVDTASNKYVTSHILIVAKKDQIHAAKVCKVLSQCNVIDGNIS
jgi:hypothetical protein